MKKLFFLSLLALVFVSCQKTETIEIESEDALVTLKFSNFTMEPMTKAVVDVSVVSSKLDVWIIEGENVLEFNQVSADANFGTISASLNKTKTYTLYAIAHKSTAAAVLEDDKISFTDNKVLDTYFYSGTFSPRTSTDLECVMNRIVGLIKITVTDAIPANVAKMKFTLSGTNLAYNVAGYGDNSGDKINIIENLSTASDGSATFNVYGIANNSTETQTVSVKAEALDSENNVIEEKTFTNVPFKCGYLTQYRGEFFVTTSVSSGFKMDNAWNNFDEMTY